MVKNMVFRCGNNEEFPYINRNGEGVVNRETRYGFLIPKVDIFVVNDGIMYGEL